MKAQHIITVAVIVLALSVPVTALDWSDTRDALESFWRFILIEERADTAGGVFVGDIICPDILLTPEFCANGRIEYRRDENGCPMPYCIPNEICANTCSPGEQRCALDSGYQICTDVDGNGCVEWSDVLECPAQAPKCLDGFCQSDVCLPSCEGKTCNSEDGCGGICKGICPDGNSCTPDGCLPTTCEDECNPESNFPRCNLRSNSIVSCDMGSDGCYDIYRQLCPLGTVCDPNTAQCVPDCKNECSPGEVQCSLATDVAGPYKGYMVCVQHDDGCYRFGPPIACEPSEICQDGFCIGNCFDNDNVCPAGCDHNNDNDCAPPPEPFCHDSDGGITPQVFGTITFGVEEPSCPMVALSPGYCENGTIIWETNDNGCSFPTCHGDQCEVDFDCPNIVCVRDPCPPLVCEKGWCVPGQVSCTEDLMLCPDGISVGRIPPRCEFAPCPPTECIDSDGGRVVEVYGEAVSSDGSSHYDICAVSKSLNSPNEIVQSCSGSHCYILESECLNGQATHAKLTCPTGCSNGICGGGTLSDTCVDDNTLQEFYCDGTNPEGTFINCQYGCSDGACLPGSTNQCNDGIDNDDDGFNDFPADPGCAALHDTDESDSSDYDNDGCTDTNDAFPTIQSPDFDQNGLGDDCEACENECDPQFHPYCVYGAGPSSSSEQCIEHPNGCFVLATELCNADEWCNDGTGLCDQTGFCGNGQIDYSEECDDGNNAGGDGCSPDCRIEDLLCGDGFINPGEECDDGNLVGGDGCRDCLLEQRFCFGNLQAFRFRTEFNQLNLYEPLGDVSSHVTPTDLPTLLTGLLATSEGSTLYDQTLRFGSSTDTVSSPPSGDELELVSVAETENDNDLFSNFLVVEDYAPFVELKIGFTDGLESSIEDGILEDLDQFPILDRLWTVIRANVDPDGSNFEMLLMDGEIHDTMREGETKTYIVNGLVYEVTLVYVSDPNSTVREAKFSVNGFLTGALQEGDVDFLNYTSIGVDTLLINEREGVAIFFLDADVLYIHDPTATDISFDGTAEFNEENLEDASVSIQGDFTTNGFEILALKYRLGMDAIASSSAYVPAGDDLREYMDEPDGLLSRTFDMHYGGVNQYSLEYLDYDHIERTVAYRELAPPEGTPGLTHEVSVNPQGTGQIIFAGQIYPIIVDPNDSDSELGVDTDNDGIYDVELEFGSSFIATQNPVIADVHLLLGECRGICGNGVVEIWEQCDDGNNQNGDGCSSVCLKEFVCGNGILDPEEQCDDGNNQNGDGCSRACKIERPLVCEAPTADMQKLFLREADTAVLDGGDLSILKDFTVGGSTETQILSMGPQPFGVNVLEDDDDDVEVYLTIEQDEPFFTYDVTFTPPLQSSIANNGILRGLIDLEIILLGDKYTIVWARMLNDILQIRMLRDAISDTLLEGETKTYVINGLDYEVSLVFVTSSGTGGEPQAKFSVNGVLSDAIGEFEIDILPNVVVAVAEIGNGSANFSIGTRYLEFNDPTISGGTDGSVEIDGENINDAGVSLEGTSATQFSLSKIFYELTMDAELGTTAYIRSHRTVRDALQRPNGMLGSTWDIMHGRLNLELEGSLVIRSVGDDSYEIRFTNINSDTYRFPYLTVENGIWKFGDDDDELVFIEPLDSSEHNVGPDDYFIVSRRANGIHKAITDVLRYSDYDNTDFVIEFEDLSSGSAINIPVATDGTASLVINGNTYDVIVDDRNSAEPSLAVDLDGNGVLNGAEVFVTVFGGPYLSLARQVRFTNSSGSQVINGTDLSDVVGNGKVITNYPVQDAQVIFRLIEPRQLFVENVAGGISGRILADFIAYEMNAELLENTATGPLMNNTDTSEYNDFELFEMYEDSRIGVTDYGVVLFEYGGPEGGDIEIITPDSRITADVIHTVNPLCPNNVQCGDGSIQPGEVCDNGGVLNTQLENYNGSVLTSAQIFLVGDAKYKGGPLEHDGENLTVTVDFENRRVSFTSDQGRYGYSAFLEHNISSNTYHASFQGTTTFFAEFDDMNFGSIQVCTDLDNFTAGTLSCNPVSCSFNTLACEGADPGVCGDGIIQPGESCDGANWGPIVGCEDVGVFNNGTLLCMNCQFDTSQCISVNLCGNGILDAGEECDDGNTNNDDNCYNDCTSGTVAPPPGPRFLGGNSGGGGGTWLSSTPPAKNVSKECKPGWSWNEKYEVCVSDSAPEPEVVESAAIGMSFLRSLSVDPLTIVDFEVTVTAEQGALEDVQVSLDMPGDWEYSGAQNLGQIAGSKTASFSIAIGGANPPQETIDVTVSTSNAGVEKGKVTVNIRCPDFIVGSMPKLTPYAASESIPIYTIICNNGGAMEDLEVETSVNRGRRTLYSAYSNVFDLPAGTKKIQSFDVRAGSVQNALVSGVLRQKGRPIKTDTHNLR